MGVSQEEIFKTSNTEKALKLMRLVNRACDKSKNNSEIVQMGEEFIEMNVNSIKLSESLSYYDSSVD